MRLWVLHENTLINFAGVKSDMLSFVSDAASAKIGKFLLKEFYTRTRGCFFISTRLFSHFSMEYRQ